MPPKPKFTREEIINTALEIVSKHGVDSLTARELGSKLGSSARPIFTVFKNMDEVLENVRSAAMKKFEFYAENSLDNMPLFKQVGMRMVMFGINEPKLYQLLFMSENENVSDFDSIFAVLGDTADICLETIQKDYSLNYDRARWLFENMWIYTFGIGTLCASGACRFSIERLSEMLSENFSALLVFAKNQNFK